MYGTDSGVLRCPLLKWSTFKSGGGHKRSYRLVLGVRWFLVLILVSNSSRRGALTIQYLVKASARDSVKLHFYTLYCAESMCSKVTHIINPHTYNTFPRLVCKHMDFRASTGRLVTRALWSKYPCICIMSWSIELDNLPTCNKTHINTHQEEISHKRVELLQAPCQRETSEWRQKSDNQTSECIS